MQREVEEAQLQKERDGQRQEEQRRQEQQQRQELLRQQEQQKLEQQRAEELAKVKAAEEKRKQEEEEKRLQQQQQAQKQQQQQARPSEGAPSSQEQVWDSARGLFNRNLGAADQQQPTQRHQRQHQNQHQHQHQRNDFIDQLQKGTLRSAGPAPTKKPDTTSAYNVSSLIDRPKEGNVMNMLMKDSQGDGLERGVSRDEARRLEREKYANQYTFLPLLAWRAHKVTECYQNFQRIPHYFTPHQVP